MPKRVMIAIDFDYDRDHANDLMDVVQVSQIYSDLPGDSAHEQTKFLFEDTEWRDAFAMAVATAIAGGTTQFGSDQN